MSEQTEQTGFNLFDARADEFPAGDLGRKFEDPKVLRYCLNLGTAIFSSIGIALALIGDYTNPHTGVAEFVFSPGTYGLSRTTFYRSVKDLENLGVLEVAMVRDAADHEYRRFIMRHGVVCGWTPSEDDVLLGRVSAYYQGERVLLKAEMLRLRNWAEAGAWIPEPEADPEPVVPESRTTLVARARVSFLGIARRLIPQPEAGSGAGDSGEAWVSPQEKAPVSGGPAAGSDPVSRRSGAGEGGNARLCCAGY